VVQVETPFSYHNGVEEKPEPSWPEAVRVAAKEFATAFSESSRQLAMAAEKFASDSQRSLEEASRNAERSASTSSAMAEAASKAAEEARSASESLRVSIEDVIARVQLEAQEAIDKAMRHAAQIDESGERVRQELQQHIDEMVARIEQSTSTSRESLSAAQTATSEAQQAAAAVNERIAGADASVSAAQAAADQARQAAARAEQNLDTANAALSAAQEAAEASRQSAAIAEQAANAPTLGRDAHELLERLENDYQLLTRLVQELHTRITGLTSVTPAAPAPQTYQPAPQSAWQEPAAPVEAPVEQPAAPAWQAPPSLAAAQPEAVSPPPGMPSMAPFARSEPAPITISGRIQLSISPVPDFDRLLHLDSSLGRMGGVQGVTLADYAQEEVTFRVELTSPISALDFARDLSDAAGIHAEVTAVSDNSLTLRLG
jgi:hypothetical protein